MAERLDTSDVHMVELNISCPTSREGGASFGTSCESVEKVTAEVRRCSAAADRQADAQCYLHRGYRGGGGGGGADALSLINTLTGMRIDLKTRRLSAQQYRRIIRSGGIPRRTHWHRYTRG